MHLTITTYRLRFALVESVQDMLDTGKAVNQKDAITQIVLKAKQKQIPIGFQYNSGKKIDILKVYNNYLQFKHKHCTDTFS